eukprot:COSAG02_NODE_2203_length_9520_cov_14.356013_16_plen_39_part_00
MFTMGVLYTTAVLYRGNSEIRTSLGDCSRDNWYRVLVL